MQIIHQQTKCMFPSHLTEQAPGLCPSSWIYWPRALCCPQTTSSHLPCYFQPSSYFTFTESSGSLIYFYYWLIWFILSLIFPKSRSQKDFCFVHCWKHNANPLQGLQGLTSILNDQVVAGCWQISQMSHKIVCLKRRYSSSLVAENLRQALISYVFHC